MDTDLDQMTREELIIEVKKLRQGIRQHRDSSRHELCWPTHRSGVFFQKGQIRRLWYLNGQSSYKAA